MNYMKIILTVTAILSNNLVFSDVLVELPNGVIRGSEKYTINDVSFYSFRQIPYATPPVGELRFQVLYPKSKNTSPPIPSENWDGILNTTQNTKHCFGVTSTSSSESEDCLHLNVFTPQLPTEDNNPSYPVMLYIHGGGFINGNSIGNGPEFLIESDVILVTIHYRLGPFGFLSTLDSVIPGNNGLRDQQLAIKWTHDNIHLFGGDPEKITIFGQSAGSASVTYQLLNKNSEGLFHGVIGESGSFLSPWSFQRNARYYAFKTASFINSSFSDSDDSQALLDFLKNVPAENIDEASKKVVDTASIENTQIVQGYFYAPVVEVPHDDAFITEKMFVSLKAGNIIKVPLLIGMNSEESITNAANPDSLKDKLTQIDNNLDWLVPNDMRIENQTEKIEIGRKIREIYTGGDLLQDNICMGVRYFSDTSFSRSIIKHAELQASFSDVYLYKFSYDGIIGNISTKCEGAEKIAHSEDVKYIFRITSSTYDNTDLSIFPEKDVTTQKRIQKIWTNFAKTFNPTPEPSELLQNITWPKVNAGDVNDLLYVDIDENLEVKNHPKEDTFSAWVEIYDSLGYDDFDTY